MKRTHTLAVLVGIVCMFVTARATFCLSAADSQSVDSVRRSGTPAVAADPALSSWLSERASETKAPNGSGKTKEVPKPPKEKDPFDPPAEPPVTPPAEPPAPPAPPEPPAPPAPPEPPAPPAAPGVPGTPVSVTCVSGDMEDRISFEAPAEGGPVASYALLRSAPGEEGYSAVATAPADARSFVLTLEATATASYRVAASGPGGQGAASEAVDNSHVSITAEVSPQGATVRSSNGELALVFPAGSVASTSTVTIEEVEGSPTGGLICLAGVYDVSSSVPLSAPARLFVAYTVRVEHFQVSAAMLSQARLMTYDASAKAWVAAATGLAAEDGMLSGDLPHFSYWSAALVQPHGTSGTAYCSSGGFCHDLTAYPGTATRLVGKDPQVCYNCHGSPDGTGDPVGATGENVQDAIAGAATLSKHPVAIGDLACTSCHDPHADPASSPGLLRSIDAVTGRYVEGAGGVGPGNAFCWTCHGTVSNRRIDYLVPGYWARTGGDKKTTFAQTRHAQVPIVQTGTSREVVNTVTREITSYYDLYKGVGSTNRNLAADSAGNFLAFSWGDGIGHPNMQINCPYPISSIDALIDNDDSTIAWIGPFPEGTTSCTYDITIDLGVTQTLSAAAINSGPMGVGNVQGVTFSTSPDGVNWTVQWSKPSPSYADGTVTQHAQGLPTYPVARFVRFSITDTYSSSYRYSGLQWLTVSINAATWGSWTTAPLSIASNGYAGASVVNYSATTPDGSAITLETRVSTDGGTTWSDWEAQPNGGSIPGLAGSPEMSDAYLMYRAMFSRSATTLNPVLNDVSHSIEIVRDVPTLSTGSNGCVGCHAPHGDEGPSLLPVSEREVCTRCHAAKVESFDASEHGAQECSGCHSVHGVIDPASGAVYEQLLTSNETALCLSCHNTPANSANGIDIQRQFTRWYTSWNSTTNRWARRHNVDEAEQALLGNAIACSDCHGVHAVTGERFLVDPMDPSTEFPKTRDAPYLAKIEPTADAFIEEGSATPQGSAATLQMGTAPRRKILVSFDLSAIPAGAQLLDATLVVHRQGEAEGVQSSTVNNLLIYRLGQSWNESGVTWTDRGGGLGPWTVGGGTKSGSAYSGAEPWGAFRYDVTALVTALRSGANYGMLLEDNGNAWVSQTTASREVTGDGPYLEVRYRIPGNPNMQYDMIDYCLRCHSGCMPSGVLVGGTSLSSPLVLKDISATWPTQNHGERLGSWPSTAHSYRAYGRLRPPYNYGYWEPLQCTVCHDAHGSSNAYHLRDDGTLESVAGGVEYAYAVQYDNGVRWCSQCHYGAGHAGSVGERCDKCHHHGPINAGRF